MSEYSRRQRNQDTRQPEDFGKSRDQLNQPQGKIKDLFRTSEGNRESSKPSTTERPPASNSSEQLTPSRPEASSDG